MNCSPISLFPLDSKDEPTTPGRGSQGAPAGPHQGADVEPEAEAAEVAALHPLAGEDVTGVQLDELVRVRRDAENGAQATRGPDGLVGRFLKSTK